MPPLAGNCLFLSSNPTCLFSIEQIIFGIIKFSKKTLFKWLKVIRESLKIETTFLKAFQFSKSFLNILGRNSKRIVFYAIKSFNLFYSLYLSLPCFCSFLKIHIKQESSRNWPWKSLLNFELSRTRFLVWQFWTGEDTQCEVGNTVFSRLNF